MFARGWLSYTNMYLVDTCYESTGITLLSKVHRNYPAVDEIGVTSTACLRIVVAVHEIMHTLNSFTSARGT